MNDELTPQAPKDTQEAPQAEGEPTMSADRVQDDERKPYPVAGGKDARGRSRRRRKASFLTINKIHTLDYKDIGLLKRFVNEQGKILPARQTGATAKEQRMISNAVSRAREMALMPFVALDSSIGDRGFGRPERGERRPRAPRQETPAPNEVSADTAPADATAQEAQVE